MRIGRARGRGGSESYFSPDLAFLQSQEIASARCIDALKTPRVREAEILDWTLEPGELLQEVRVDAQLSTVRGLSNMPQTDTLDIVTIALAAVAATAGATAAAATFVEVGKEKEGATEETVENEMVAHIVASIEPAINRAELIQLGERRKANLSAWQLYRRSHALLAQQAIQPVPKMTPCLSLVLSGTNDGPCP